MINVRFNNDFESFKHKARQLLHKRVSPEMIEWQTDSGLFFGESWEDIEVSEVITFSKEVVELVTVVSAYRDSTTWPLLYRFLYRLKFETPDLLKNPLDDDVLELQKRYRLVMRDVHKMKAFIRFKEVSTENGTVFMAWHRPDHKILRIAAPFFKERFQGMNWVIMTEDETAQWIDKELHFSEGVSSSEAPQFDEKEDLWKTYYRAIFNPARVKIGAMKKELPVRHWKTLPETELISGLIKEAPSRLKEFYDSQKVSASASAYSSIEELNINLLKCRACGICEKATAPVRGTGRLEADIMIIGEQPGHEEDLAGLPFVGPSGELLDRALSEAKLDRSSMYVTNAVKGFKFIPKAHMRWHKGANLSEITTCKPWLKNEIELVKPKTIVCLGRTAALSVTGKLVKMEDVKGKFFQGAFTETIILPHPSSILRKKEDQESAIEEYFDHWKKISQHKSVS